ncbi:MAG: sel1 repeat family protein [Rhizobiaceae bacterium]|nr:sel1 repeat family protein [Rhizobiaceae bacterium]
MEFLRSHIREFEMYFRVIGSTIAIAALLVASPTLADVRDDCHRMGGLHVEWEDLKPDQIIPACKAAVAAEPEDGYFSFLLGRALNRNNEFAEALAAYKRAEQLGNSEATTNIGYMYLFGEGVAKDPGQAWAHFRTALFGHSSTASVAIAYVYEHGLGRERDVARAGELYSLAAKNGQAQALVNLGDMLWHGRGVEKNVGFALTAYQAASDAGSAKAQLFLAKVYKDGNGVGADAHKAAFYFEKALISGSQAAADEINTNWSKWPVEVAKALQLRLKKSALYDGEIDGVLSQQTVSAISRIFNTAPIPPRVVSAKQQKPHSPTDPGDLRSLFDWIE